MAAILYEKYQILITTLSVEDGGGFLATVPELPGCMSDGESRCEALQNAQVAIEEWIETAKELGRPIPEPKIHSENDPSGKFTARLPKTLHAQLIRLADQQGVSLNNLVNMFLAMGVGNNFSLLKTVDSTASAKPPIPSINIFTSIEEKEKWEKKIPSLIDRREMFAGTKGKGVFQI